MIFSMQYNRSQIIHGPCFSIKYYFHVDEQKQNNSGMILTRINDQLNVSFFNKHNFADRLHKREEMKKTGILDRKKLGTPRSTVVVLFFSPRKRRSKCINDNYQLKPHLLDPI